MRIKIRDIEFYYNSTKILDRITLEIGNGENLYIIGPNGAGKTTLLKVIARVLEPIGGVVYIDGKDYRLYNPRELAKMISYVDPYVDRSIPSTVYHFLLTARYPHQKPLQIVENENDIEIIDRVSKAFNINHLLDRRLDQLSSGELQRVVIARAFVQEPQILLLDEPSAFLDIRYRMEILEYVKRFISNSNRIAITAIHDLYLASLYADRIAVLSNGKIVAIGTAEEVFSNRIIEDVYGVKIELIKINGKYIPIPVKTLSSQSTPPQ